jgi:transposase-like protein
VSFKGAPSEKDLILTRLRWYVTYPLSYRQLDELMQECGVSVGDPTIHRRVPKYAPQLVGTKRGQSDPCKTASIN